MKIKTILKITILGLCLFTMSCKKNDVSTTETQNSQFAREAVEDDGNSDEEPVLGETLNNPYLVANMQKAFDELDTKGEKSICPIKVRPTHYYVKFKPKNMDEYEKLDNDDRIPTSEEVPLDKQVLVDGGNYHDPSLPDSVPTYQYCSVKIDYPFDLEVEYEILATLYIPEEDVDLNCSEDNEDYIDKLLDQAYTQTRNYDDVVGNALARGCGRYSPSGRIELFDTRLNANIGMQGIRVKARRWFTTRIMLTDFNGNYSTNKTFKRPCNYSLKFGRPMFCVRKHFIPGTYRVGGPKKCGDWNTVLSNGYQRFAGHLFRAAQTYFYQNIGGLTHPFHFKRQVIIGVDKNMSGTAINWIVLPIIRVGRFETLNERERELFSDEAFSATCHELAHSVHCFKLMNFAPVQFWQVDAQVRESFAVGIEWFLTQREYQMRGIPNYARWDYWPTNPPIYPGRQGYQYWNKNIDAVYTNLFINLVDDFNETIAWTAANTPDDEVTGYTFPFIEQNIMRHSYGLTSLRNEVKAHKPSTNVTDAQIDRLFSFY